MAPKWVTAVTLIMMLQLTQSTSTSTSTPTSGTFNETCLGADISFDLQFHLYQNSCPEAESIVFSWVESAMSVDPRMAASLLRLHFHDCFVNAWKPFLFLCQLLFQKNRGCDGSVLLDDTDTFQGEKTAPPNLNSLRGFEVIDAIKSEIETVCPQVVSCADILAIAARDSVLIVCLCTSFSSRIQAGGGGPDVNLDFVQSLQQLCSQSDSGSSATTAHLDNGTPMTFDNQYYINLLSGEGLLPSDQALTTQDEETRMIVELYVQDPDTFFNDFRNSMLKMGSLVGITGNSGEIRRNCRSVNSAV
ncbi:Peroxidase 40 [Linum grandiflorum]